MTTEFQHPKPILEVCCGDIQSIYAAKTGGAHRIELCSALSEGGVTPSAGLIREAVSSGIPAVHILIRPRGGDFLYSEDEIRLMETDIRCTVSTGVDGVVIGALTSDGDIDMTTCRRLIETAGDCSVTFHRAFDLCRNPQKALEDIISLGCDRILTSGLARSAMEGAETLRRLNRQAARRITLLAGGGVTPDNAREILSSTGLNEIHASAKTSVASAMTFRRQSVCMGIPDKDEYIRTMTDAATVAAIISAISG
ncbi:copper homeostasis protein CutC [uncultured Duncaniella sp.]|uniref:copper homeostasis protein CutC n=1 Tax=uncultured Duncaniella sp. TaxID=2768039 RepID=UPI00272A3786|nr:copper homeostasis protein CutC [uncultured Duncaniella sp.]